jgi:hypothetical protein
VRRRERSGGREEERGKRWKELKTWLEGSTTTSRTVVSDFSMSPDSLSCPCDDVEEPNEFRDERS